MRSRAEVSRFDKSLKVISYKLFEINCLYLILLLALLYLDNRRFSKYPTWVQQIPHSETSLAFKVLQICVLDLVIIENKVFRRFSEKSWPAWIQSGFHGLGQIDFKKKGHQYTKYPICKAELKIIPDGEK